MENKNKLFGYVPSLSDFNKLKVSADIDNKTYTIGGGSVQQCAEGEVPDIRWHIVVFIEDVTRIWTHGKFYASANAKLSDDYASPVYVEVKDLETGEVLFNPAKPGETIEEAILQLDTNVANLLAEILKNEEVVSKALNEHNLASGFNDNGKYIQQTTAKYISGATSLADADNLLDAAISSIASNVEALSGDLSGLFIPTKTSDLTNDSGYITSAAIPTKVSAFENDAKYAYQGNIPTKVSQLENDSKYLTSYYVPTKVSEFNNDAKYQTESDVKAAIDGLINGAPGTLDTLGEIAEILSENTDGIGALVEELAKKANTADVNTALDNKADKSTVTTLSETVDDVKESIDSITGSTNNVYTANGSAQYISDATSLKDADNKLDAAIAGVASELSNLYTEVSKIEIPKKVSAFENDAKYAYQGNIPTKVSQLENDSKYLTSYYVPTKVSEFNNDANYATKSEIPTKLGQLTNDANYAKSSEIPTTTGQLTNNSGFITMSDVEAKKYITIDQVPEVSVPQNLSELTNDVGFITLAQVPKVDKDLSKYDNSTSKFVSESELTGKNYITMSDVEGKNYITMDNVEDKNYITMSEVEAKDYATKAELPTVPTKVSQLENDANYATKAELPKVPTNVSAFTNDANYITLADVPEVSKDLSQYDNSTSNFISKSELEAKDYATKSELPKVPTNVSAFNNDAGYITSAAIPTNVSAFTNDANYAIKDEIPTTVAELTDESNYAKKTDLPTTVAELTDESNYAKKTDLPTVPTKVSAFDNDANYATTSYVATELEKKADNTLTQDSKVYPEVKNLETQEILFTNIVAGDTLEAAILKTDANTATLVEEVLKNEEVISTTLNQLNVSSGFGEDAKYIQKTTANYISGATSLADADNLLDAAIKNVETSVGNMHIPTTVAELTDAGNYAKKTDLPTVPTNVSAFTNDANYITSAAIPTKLSAFENDCTYMTAAEVETKVASLVDSAPETLNTLNELAAALGDDPNFAATVSTEIGKKADLTYVTSELEKKADDKLSQDSVIYPNVIYDGAELFTNTYANVSLEQAILNVDKNAKTLVEEVLKNEEVISTALNEHNVSAGFTINGKYEQQTDANYISGATSLADADNLLDAAIKNVETSVGNMHIPTTVAELTDAGNYAKKTDLPTVPTNVSAFTNDANYITIEDVEDKKYITSAAIPTKLSAFENDCTYMTAEEIQDELDTKASNYISYDGATYPEVDDINSETEGTTYIFVNTYEGTSLEQYVRNVDDNLARLVQECLDTEFVVSSALNQFNISAGFDEQVKYVQNASAQYISGATSLADADNLLDAAIKTVADSVEQKIGNIDFSTYVTKQQLVNAAYVTSTSLTAFNYADKAYVSSYIGQEIAKLIDTAPQTLDTLNELAAALGDDPNFSTTVMTEIGTKASITYVTTELEKKANSTVAGEFNEYPVLKNTHTGEELFVNCYDGIAVSDAIHNIDKNTYTLVGEIIKNEEVISNAFSKINTSAGFDENAKFVLKENANVIGGATNLTEAINLLDENIGNASIERDGAYFPIVRDITTEEEKYLFSYLYAGDSITDAIYKTDSNVATLAYEVIRNEYVVSGFAYQINNSIGLNEYAEYVPKSSANYISDAKSLVDADNKLDAAIKSTNDSIDSLNTAIDNIQIPTTVAELNDSSDYYKKSELTRVSQLYNDSEYQRKPEVESIVSTYIANIVNSAPETLDTLNELAAALGDDANFATTITGQIATKANKTITGDSVKYREIQDINNPGTYFFINSYDGIELEQFVRNVDANTATLVNEVCKNEQVISTAINQLNVSSGFGEDAKYAPNTTATYISSATSLVEADNLLDNAISDVYSALTNYATKTEVSAKADNVLGSDYVAVEYQKIVNVNNTETEEVLFDPVVAGDTIANAIKKLDQNISTLVDETVKNELVVATAVNVLNESCGFGTNAKYVQYTDGYVIANATSLQHADRLLDESIGFYLGVNKPINTIDELVTVGKFIVPTDKHVCIFNLLPGDYTDVTIPEVSMEISGTLAAGKEISVYIHTNTTTAITQLNLCGLSNGPLTDIPKNSTVKVSITSDGTNIYSCGSK